ncbi:MAG: hypothetical protein ABIG95_06225 [Candidatus Woesearchaeota archaeon]
MKITIDTCHDSKEDLKRLISFLQTLVDQPAAEFPSGDNVFGNILSEPKPKEKFSLSDLQVY